MATSALASSISKLRPWRGNQAVPMEVRSIRSSPSIWKARRRWAWMISAALRAVSSLGRLEKTSAYSSPVSRLISRSGMSRSSPALAGSAWVRLRKAWRRLSATCCSTRSPARWPKASLMRRNRSMSSIMMAATWPAGRRRRSSIWPFCMKAARLNRPVSGSRLACSRWLRKASSDSESESRALPSPSAAGLSGLAACALARLIPCSRRSASWVHCWDFWQ